MPERDDEVVQRLRAEACGCSECPHAYCELHDRAADEIERLRSAVRDALFHLAEPAHNDTARGVLEAALSGSSEQPPDTTQTHQETE